jgi:hypothetical protein
MAAEDTAFVVEEEGRAGADETRQRGEDVGDDLLRRRQADEIGDRFPPALALLAAPDDADDTRWVSPSRNAKALTRTRAEVASWILELPAGSPPARRTAIVIRSAATLSMRMRCRATLGWSRPALQRLTATNTERTVQSTRSAIK